MYTPVPYLCQAGRKTPGPAASLGNCAASRLQLLSSGHGPRKASQTFFFQDHPVGYFEDVQLPAAPGDYRYMPYRGPGHLRLMGALKSLGPQRVITLRMEENSSLP